MAKRGELQRQVESCLAKYPRTRNSDIELTIAIWKEYYPQRIFDSTRGMPAIELHDLFDLPREDNVKRIRAKIQNELGKFLPTSLEVAKQRQINEEEWRNYMRRFPVTPEEPEEKTETSCPHGLPLFVNCPQCNF